MTSLEKLAKALSARRRNALADSAFALPEERRYPIPDANHARNALARASGKPEEATVRAAVHRRYPGIGEKQADETPPAVTAEPTPAEIAALKNRFKHWRKKLERKGVFAGTYHKRITIPKARLSEAQIKQLGFEPVLIAIPEAGQDQFSSYRHPNNLYHIHSHGDNWTMHEDSHPALTMALRTAKPGETLKAIKDGMTHVVTEGIPGAYKYITHRLTGAGTMLDAIKRDMSGEPREKAAHDALAVLGLVKAANWGEMSDAAQRAILGGTAGLGLGALGGGLYGYAKSDEPDAISPWTAALLGGLSLGTLGAAVGGLHGHIRPAPPGPTTVMAQAARTRANTPDFYWADGKELTTAPEIIEAERRVSNTSANSSPFKTGHPDVRRMFRTGRHYTLHMDPGHVDDVGRVAPIAVHGTWRPGDTVDDVVARARELIKAVPPDHAGTRTT